MKIAVVYNYESKDVINLFGLPNKEKYGLGTIKAIASGLRAGGHQVQAFEADKHIIERLEEFMPAVIAGERPGLVFNLSYGIQGRARYTHVPGILEMLGIPYVGSSPDTHALALDKVITKMILNQKGLPTPRFDVLDGPDSPVTEDLRYPLIVKPKNEAVSYGLRVVRNEEELREGVAQIKKAFQQPTLVEEYIEGQEVNVGLLGNDPVEALPPVLLDFGEGEQILTYEDKTHRSGREIEKICPAPLGEERTQELQELCIKAYRALGCLDCARVDLRLDRDGRPFILEINSMASLGKGGSYVFAAAKRGLDYAGLVNRLVEVASQRYFGTPLAQQVEIQRSSGEQGIFNALTRGRDRIEKDLQEWTNISSRTNDAVQISTVARSLHERLGALGLTPIDALTNQRAAWTWSTNGGFKQGTLLVVTLDTPIEQPGFPILFRREPEWLHGEGIATSRGGIVTLLAALGALRSARLLKGKKIGVFAYADEGRGMRYSAPLLQEAAGFARRVLVMRPGFREGKAVDQHRGLRKYRVQVDGEPLRVGSGGRIDALTWVLEKAGEVAAVSQPSKRLALSVQEITTERFSVLMPHRVTATLCLSFLEVAKADAVEKRLHEIFAAVPKGVRARIEILESRPPFLRASGDNTVAESLASLSEAWHLPFGLDSSLLPSPAGEVAEGTPVLSGLAPAGVALFTPNEALHRGELLQRSLLLALYLGGFKA